MSASVSLPRSRRLIASRRWCGVSLCVRPIFTPSSLAAKPGPVVGKGVSMIEPYTAIGLIPTFWGARRRDDIKKQLDHLGHLTKAATMLSNLEIPVRLVVIPEGALQGFNDEVLDVDHAEYARTCAIDIPGRETEVLGSLAKQYHIFIMAEAKARHADWPDLFFNIGFVIDPNG